MGFLEILPQIICYLSSPEIARLSQTNKEINKSLISLKALKLSIWRGDMPNETRAKFWIYQSPLYCVQNEVAKLLMASSSVELYRKIIKKIQSNELLEDQSINLEQVKSDIFKDIPRTYLVAGHSKEELQLSNILMAVGYVKSSIGYCQGMNFIAAVILKVVKSEEIAFWLVLGIMKKWDMENMYVSGVPDLPLREFQMNHCINSKLPEIYAHFRRIGVTNGFFITRWFMTLFSTQLPLEVLVKVWDCFLIEGWKAIFKVGIGMLKVVKSDLLQYDLTDISKFLRVSHKDVDYKELLETSKGVIISKNELNRIEEEFYMSQVNFKLMAVELSHISSESDVNMIKWGKTQISSFDDVTKSDYKEFQRKISRLDSELETFTKHYLVVTMDFARVHSELESLVEKKSKYSQILKDIKKKFRKGKISQFLKKILTKKKKNSGISALSQEDVNLCEIKLKKIENELKEVQFHYHEKETIYREALIRGQDLNERKKKYSSQLCDFLASKKDSFTE